MWTDAHAIYMEIPHRDGGPPYITSYPLNDGGLGKALAHMKRHHKVEAPSHTSTFTYAKARHPSTRIAPTFSEENRQSVRDMLRKMKII